MTQTTSLKNKLENKRLTIGSWLSWGFTPVTEIMAKSGFDWLVIDLEHTAIDFYQAHQMIQTIDLAGCFPLVRVGDNDKLTIKRVLDSGAGGIVVPMVNNAEEAKRAVDATYYPPRGSRGVGLARAQGYGVDFESYRQRSMEETVIIVQIEHILGVDNLEDILSVEGVDGFIIGPYDLSGSLGKPGQFDHPDVTIALQKVKDIMNSSVKPGGYHVVQTCQKELTSRINEGFRFLAYGDDMVIFAQKLKEEDKFLNSLNRK